MRCEYNNGLTVSYAGPLRIKSGSNVNVFLEPEEIPEDIREELFEAAVHESCRDLKRAAYKVTDMFGTHLPEQ